MTNNPSNVEVKLVADLRRAITRLSRRLRGERSANTLSASKLGVLSYLFRNQRSSPGAIAMAEHLQPQSLSKLLAELETEELISRIRDRSDGRQSTLKLTQKGRDALVRDMRERDVWLASAISYLSVTELEVLRIAAPIMEYLADYTATNHSPETRKATRETT
jgi:DNA-binding MarR family transcriptional regulator